MSVNIYPAHLMGNDVIHADSWAEESTLNLANGNFYSMADELGLYLQDPGHITVKALAMALKTHHSPRYSEKLKKLIAQAEVLRAKYIAFS
jgi:hypothetical protein